MFKRVKSSILVSVSFLVALILIGTNVYVRLENWTWIQAFYFSVTTLTTVGYGDLTPSTELSMLFTSIYILAGVGIALASLGIIGSYIISEREKKVLAKRKRKK